MFGLDMVNIIVFNRCYRNPCLFTYSTQSLLQPQVGLLYTTIEGQLGEGDSAVTTGDSDVQAETITLNPNRAAIEAS